jgi:uncharacterized membrane protein YeaQ/YmgE (transglycosylase-associated protein family)
MQSADRNCQFMDASSMGRVGGISVPKTGVLAKSVTSTTHVRGLRRSTQKYACPAIAGRRMIEVPHMQGVGNHNKSGDEAMNIIIWLVVGGLIGWLASIFMRTDQQQGIALNVVVGIVGSVLGGWFLSPLFGVSTINQSNFSVAGLLVSFLGAVILLAIVNLIRRGRAR